MGGVTPPLARILKNQHQTKKSTKIARNDAIAWKRCERAHPNFYRPLKRWFAAWNFHLFCLVPSSIIYFCYFLAQLNWEFQQWTYVTLFLFCFQKSDSSWWLTNIIVLTQLKRKNICFKQILCVFLWLPCSVIVNLYKFWIKPDQFWLKFIEKVKLKTDFCKKRENTMSQLL